MKKGTVAGCTNWFSRVFHTYIHSYKHNISLCQLIQNIYKIN